jgi:hypothetical protein
MATSSSVNWLFAFSGSVQSKATGVVMERLPMAERSGAFNCLAACLHTGRNIFVYVTTGVQWVENSGFKSQTSRIYSVFERREQNRHSLGNNGLGKPHVKEPRHGNAP